jgi:hypothetical protein
MASIAQEKLLRDIDELLASHTDLLQRYILLTEHVPYLDAKTMLDILCHELHQRDLTQQQCLQDHSGAMLLYEAHADGAQHSLLLYNSFSLPNPGLWELLPIVTQFMAIDIYRKLCTNYPPVTYKWLLQGVEEYSNSALGLENCIKKLGTHLCADGCLCDNTQVLRETGLIDEHTPLLALGAKGLLRIQLSVRTAPQPLPAQYGSIVPDAAWRLLWALNSLKNAQEEILIEGFYNTLKTPDDDVIALLHNLPDTAQCLGQQFGLDHFLYDLQGFQLHYAHYLLPTCTVGSLASQSETAPHLYPHIPALSNVELNFHLLPDQDPQDIFSLLRHHLDTQGFSDIQATMLYACPSYYTPLADPFVQTVLQATARSCNGENYVLPFTPESLPLHQIRHTLHMPIVITAMNTCDITPMTWQNEKLKRIMTTAIKQTILTLTTIASRP